VNVEYINPFIDAVLNVLRTMAQTDAKAGKPYLKKDKASQGDVTGLIGMAREGSKGSIAVSFSAPCILKVVSNMLMEDFTQLTDEVTDAVGEITNMVSGGARKTLSEKGFKFEMAIPTIIVGERHTITHMTTGPVIVLPFETPHGPFFIEICIVDINR
jgi:chemotaxis protein CheX